MNIYTCPVSGFDEKSGQDKDFLFSLEKVKYTRAEGRKGEVLMLG